MTYLDHAAATPILPSVVAAWTAANRLPGNASSLHAAGRAARRLVEESRETIAAALGAVPSEVIFTSGGTEADNLAVTGLFRARRAADPGRSRILVPAIEHPAVLDTVEYLARSEGAKVDWLECDPLGRVHPNTLETAIESNPDDVALVSVMWANNEVGTVNPIPALADVAARHDIPLHTDAVQAIGQVPVHFGESGAAALSFSGHKLGGPGGVGALLLRRDAKVVPLLHGGGQERDVRSGTLDVAGISGLAVAVTDATGLRATEAARLTALRDRLVTGVLAAAPGAMLSGDPGLDEVNGGPSRLPGNVHLRFPGCRGDSLLMLLDELGIECSTGSACTAGVARASHVLLAMGLDEAESRAALRFSLGHPTTDDDIDHVLRVIGPVVERARAAALAGSRRRA